MRESIKMKTPDFSFKFRVAGVVIKDEKLLFVQMDESGFLCLPGGHVELGETTEEAVCREMEEELGYKLEIVKYLGIIENFFHNKYGQTMHEICFYYLLKPLKEEEGVYEDYTLIENDKGRDVKLDFKWINFKDLAKYDIRPHFLVNVLAKQPLNIGHIICNEL